jgi:hypothetical protein
MQGVWMGPPILASQDQVSKETHPNPDPEIMLFAAVLHESLMAQSGFFTVL